jgi:3-hydroxyacyl-[acyl-carrier-protein] dehydratase
MPGVLIVEAMAQVAAVVCMGLEENKGKLGVFTGIDKCKFRRQVVPGDTIRMEVEMTALRRGIGKAETKAYVGEELACSANLTFALI